MSPTPTCARDHPPSLALPALAGPGKGHLMVSTALEMKTRCILGTPDTQNKWLVLLTLKTRNWFSAQSKQVIGTEIHSFFFYSFKECTVLKPLFFFPKWLSGLRPLASPLATPR